MEFSRFDLLLISLVSSAHYAACQTKVDFASAWVDIRSNPVELFLTELWGESIKINCPTGIGDVKLSLHPDNQSNDDGLIRAYVWKHGKLEIMPLQDIIVQHRGCQTHVNTEKNGEYTQLYIKIENNTVLKRDIDSIVFVCGQRRDASDTSIEEVATELFKVRRNNSLRETEMKLRERFKNTYIGAVNINLRYLITVTHGCGNVPTEYFSPNTVFKKDALVPTCIVDVMQTPHVGFYCENGHVEPYPCFRFLYVDKEDGTTGQYNVGEGANYKVSEGVIASSFKSNLIHEHFEGYCVCLSNVAVEGELVELARIIVVNRPDPVINLANMIMLQHLQPSNLPWYQMHLTPGTTLTIKYPPLGSYNPLNEVIDPDDVDSPFTLPATYESSFFPKDPASNVMYLKNERNGGLVEGSIASSISGTALTVDTSKMQEGEIKIRYEKGKPLHPKENSPIFYGWNFHNLGDLILKNISSKVMVHLVPNYSYTETGCSPIESHMFLPRIAGRAFSTEEIRHKHGVMNHCVLTLAPVRRVNMYCPPGQRMVPAGCDKLVYNANKWKEISMKPLVKQEVSPITGMTHIYPNPLRKNPYSVSCSCIDENGLETARLDINNLKKYQVLSMGWYNFHIDDLIIQSVQMKGCRRYESMKLMDNYSIQIGEQPIVNTVKMQLGTSLILRCINLRSTIEAYERGRRSSFYPNMLYPRTLTPDYEKDNFGPERWFPEQSSAQFYEIVEDLGDITLVPKKFDEVVAKSKYGFKVYKDSLTNDSVNDTINIQLPKNAIVISKESRKNITMAYACASVSITNERIYHNPPNPEANAVNPEGGNAVNPGEEDDVGGGLDEELDIPILRFWGIDGRNDTGRYTTFRNLKLYDVVKVKIPVTDPYVQGCGVVGKTEKIFKDTTEPLLEEGQNVGCIVDLRNQKKAGFYCPLPYITDPPSCGIGPAIKMPFKGPSVKPSDVKVYRSNNFYIFKKVHFNPIRHFLKKETESYECKCTTNTGKVLSTIRVIV